MLIRWVLLEVNLLANIHLHLPHLPHTIHALTEVWLHLFEILCVISKENFLSSQHLILDGFQILCIILSSSKGDAITWHHKLSTCNDLIRFLCIRTFIPRVLKSLCLVAVSQSDCVRKWPLKWYWRKGSSTGRRTRGEEGQAWSTVSLILDGRKRARSPIMRKELQFFLKLSGDRENKNDIQLTNERSLT